MIQEKPMNKFRQVFLVIATLLVASCKPIEDQEATAIADTRAVTIMTFNVENLFDNIDDPGKDDKAYLAIGDKQSAEHKAACAEVEVPFWREQCLNWDWSDAIVDRKLTAIANAILQVDAGRGPDILALQEVENINILERLRIEYLADAGYHPAILIEGQDERGIDLAFLSRFESVTPPQLHAISFADDFPQRDKDTRGILQADFQLADGTVLTGYAVHFPAPYHPTEMRIAAYDQLNQLLSTLPAERPVFAAGDFNTTSTEDREKNMLDRFARPYWTVTHDAGCGDCKGTNYYSRDDNWSFLDMILWSPSRDTSEHSAWQLRENSTYIANRAGGQVRDNGTPARFTLPDGAGVSDHWPVVMTIELQSLGQSPAGRAPTDAN
jgi:endonuclease/exonuclease/phosphatase family metal-dependent hydrolase